MRRLIIPGQVNAVNQFGFVNPNHPESINSLSSDIPMYLVRAGQDQMPHLNESIDQFIGIAMTRNLTITLANYAAGSHAFDLFDDTEASREIIKNITTFLQFHLNQS